MKRNFLLILSVVFSMNVVNAQLSVEKTFSCYFDYNASSWNRDSIAKLEKWLKPYLQKQELKIDLLAYTDTIGTDARNMALAGRRLHTVQHYFESKGLKINHTSVLGEGYDQSHYKTDKLYRKVEVIVSFQDPVVVKTEEKKESELKERIEAFAKSTAPINLNIQFVGGEAIYIGNSEQEVEALYLYLKDNPNKKAFIRGHVCCADDFPLSHARAAAVYNDLINKGISRERISFKGFANTIPVAAEIDEPSRQMNRRVDVVFSDI